MNVKKILAIGQRFVTDNSPGILTGLGVAGTVATAVLTGKAGYSAALIISSERDAFPHEPTAREKAELVWKEFIPPAVVGVVTLAAIISANHIGARRTAAIAAAFKISENVAEEYKQKVVDTIGKNAEEKIRAQVAKERIERAPGSETLIITGPQTMFYDTFSGRLFASDMETVKQAINRVNHQVNNCFYASLTDFYDAIGLDKTAVSDEFGWNANELLDVQFAAIMTKDDKPAIAMDFNKAPIRHYDRVQ